MRAGKLDRIITLEAPAFGAPNEFGTPAEAWDTPLTVRAQMMQHHAKEERRDYGEATATQIVFQIRFMPGITTAYRVGFEGRYFNIREIVEIGRQRGLDLHCEEVR